MLDLINLRESFLIHLTLMRNFIHSLLLMSSVDYHLLFQLLGLNVGAIALFNLGINCILMLFVLLVEFVDMCLKLSVHSLLEHVHVKCKVSLGSLIEL